MSHRRRVPAEASKPMLYRIVGICAGVCGYALFPALIIASVVSVPIFGNRPDNNVVMVLLGWACFAVGIGLALAFLNGVGIAPCIDDSTGRFLRLRGSQFASAVARTAIAAVVAIAFLCIALFALLSFVFETSQDTGILLAAIAGGGILFALTSAALVAAVLMLGWPGVFIGLAFGAGFSATIVGISAPNSTALGFGIAGLAVACAGLYTGGRLSQRLPETLAKSIVSGAFIVLGIVALVVWWFTLDSMIALFGALTIGASIGYFVAGALQRRASRAAPAGPAPR